MLSIVGRLQETNQEALANLGSLNKDITELKMTQQILLYSLRIRSGLVRKSKDLELGRHILQVSFQPYIEAKQGTNSTKTLEPKGQLFESIFQILLDISFLEHTIYIFCAKIDSCFPTICNYLILYESSTIVFQVC